VFGSFSLAISLQYSGHFQFGSALWWWHVAQWRPDPSSDQILRFIVYGHSPFSMPQDAPAGLMDSISQPAGEASYDNNKFGDEQAAT